MCLCGNKANEGVVKVCLVLSTVYARQLTSVIVSYALAYSQECDVQMSEVLWDIISRGPLRTDAVFVGCLFGLACGGALCVLVFAQGFLTSGIRFPDKTIHTCNILLLCYHLL